MLIKSRLKHYVLESYRTNCLQATSICLTEISDELTLSLVYCPPNSELAPNNFNSLFWHGANAKHTHWDSRLVDSKGKEFWKVPNGTKNYDFISSGHLTYWRTDHYKIPDLIHFKITKNIHGETISAASCYHLSSDHCPIIIQLLE